MATTVLKRDQSRLELLSEATACVLDEAARISPHTSAEDLEQHKQPSPPQIAHSFDVDSVGLPSTHSFCSHGEPPSMDTRSYTPNPLVPSLSHSYGNLVGLVNYHTAFVPPRAHLQRENEPKRSSFLPPAIPEDASEHLLARNRELQEQLQQKEETILDLLRKVDSLESQIAELKSLPTGKISQIPVDDMIHIMQEYGSETSDVSFIHNRKANVQKSSIVRQFRRYNPNFFEHVSRPYIYTQTMRTSCCKEISSHPRTF